MRSRVFAKRGWIMPTVLDDEESMRLWACAQLLSLTRGRKSTPAEVVLRLLV
jgi:hypothetical protein